MAASRLITAFGLFVAFSIPAFAGMPPEEFDHRFPGKLIEHVVPFGQAERMCSKVGKRLGKRRSGLATFGCSFGGKLDGVGWCEIVVSYDPGGADKRMASNTRRHEIGHCNGWAADHPNALP